MELREVSLTDMLEARVLRQRELQAKYQNTLISFTMNIAGPVKNSDLILQGYLKGLDLLRMQLGCEGFSICMRRKRGLLPETKLFLL